MSTGIQWTDETWNPVVGCQQITPGCGHCYAKALHDMRHRAFLAGKQVAPQYAVPFETVQLKPERLGTPLSWRKPRRVFVNSVSDLFHDDVPDAFIAQVFAVMALAERHTFQVLTKRPARMQALLSSVAFWDAVIAAAEAFYDRTGWDADEGRSYEAWVAWINETDVLALPNVWLGVSVENQRWADERIPLLAETPAAVRFLSGEPLLGPLALDFDDIAWRSWDGRRIDWCIIGGESGAGARPFHLRWARDVLRQCEAVGVTPFVKQLGAMPYSPDDRIVGQGYDGSLGPTPQGFSRYLNDRHGADMAEWPADLRVRQFPEARS